MANDQKQYIAKIKLSDNSVHYVKDLEALRLSGGTMTGNLTVDAQITANNLYIMETQFIEYKPDNVLVMNSEGKIMKRSTDILLEDIGGTSYNIDESNGILSLKVGK